MSGHDAFERILTSLHEAMLDDVHWPTTTALIDEACGLTSNTLLVGEGPKDDLRVLFVGLYYRGQRSLAIREVDRAFGHRPSVLQWPGTGGIALHRSRM